MNAIILAAGAGARLQPLSLTKPKALIRVNGIPLIEHQIRGYLKAGVEMESIRVISGYRYDHVAHFISHNYPNVQLTRNRQYRSTNNMYSLFLGLQCLESTGVDESLCISNGDCIYDESIMQRLSTAPDNAIVGDTSRYDDESMKVTVENARVTDISKTISRKDASAVSVDLYKLDFQATKKLRKIVEDYIVQRREMNLWTEVALRDLLQIERFELVDIAGAKWAEIDTVNDLLEADKRFSPFNLHKKRCFIMDLDGTVYQGNRSIPGTVTFINANNNRRAFYFASDNTSRIPDECLETLNSIGICTSLDHILTPLAPLISYLKDANIKNVFLLANTRVTEYISKALPELTTASEGNTYEALVVAYDTELTYEKLKEAALLLQQNPHLLFLATHNDITCPTEHGFIPDSGCILVMLELTTGRKPTVIFGKPGTLLIEAIRHKYRPSQMVVVGDRLYTDRALAQNIGCDFICVLSGETTREQLDELSEDDVPSLILRDLGELLK